MAKPIVDGIEKDIKDEAEVVRLNLLSAVGREVASRYGVSAVPTILILEPDGTVAYRHTGTPDRREVVDVAVAGAVSPDP